TTGIDLSDLVGKASTQGGSKSAAGWVQDDSTTVEDSGNLAASGFSDSGDADAGDADDEGQVVEGQVAEGRGGRSDRDGRSSRDGRGGAKPSGLGDPSAWTGGNFDPKDYLDDNGELDLSHIGDDVKKATGIDVQSYIADALRRRDGRDGDSDGSGSNGPKGGSGGPDKK
ncbi:MAG: flotillin, partial [Brevibacterium sp.]|nr:flotillin [Brevibacterium sp.]